MKIRDYFYLLTFVLGYFVILLTTYENQVIAAWAVIYSIASIDLIINSNKKTSSQNIKKEEPKTLPSALSKLSV